MRWPRQENMRSFKCLTNLATVRGNLDATNREFQMIALKTAVSLAQSTVLVRRRTSVCVSLDLEYRYIHAACK